LRAAVCDGKNVDFGVNLGLGRVGWYIIIVEYARILHSILIKQLSNGPGVPLKEREDSSV
jgi:hypothetical protein